MLKADPAAAKKYLIAREYISQCRQVVANPNLAIDLPNEPDGADWKYITKADQEILKDAVGKSIAAEINKAPGPK
jgi:hypothetical protein